tara:strand:+ start:267 stop:470 length:204 start_codon:yes stop_codon:yes gene_type:complete
LINIKISTNKEFFNMREYHILLQNRINQNLKNKNILKLTFPEAVTEAFKIKSQLGFDWEISQIKRVK